MNLSSLQQYLEERQTLYKMYVGQHLMSDLTRIVTEYTQCGECMDDDYWQWFQLIIGKQQVFALRAPSIFPRCVSIQFESYEYKEGHYWTKFIFHDNYTPPESEDTTNWFTCEVMVLVPRIA